MKTLLVLFGASILLLSACNNSSNEKVADEKTVKKDCSEVKWTHKAGPNGPENWKNLCDGFSDCGGKAQSPIDIVTASVSDTETLTPVNFNYATSNVDIINNGHTVQFNISGNNTMTVQNKEYKLLQFHYHALSEHTINGEYYPLEVHFVHQHSETDYAVLGVMFTEGNENELLTKYLANFPTEKGKFAADESIEIAKLFPSNMSYYHYNGSLTTPPCSEVVNWYVLKNPLEASKEQLEEFAKILHNNYRPIMPLNERIVHNFSE